MYFAHTCRSLSLSLSLSLSTPPPPPPLPPFSSICTEIKCKRVKVSLWLSSHLATVLLCAAIQVGLPSDNDTVTVWIVSRLARNCWSLPRVVSMTGVCLPWSLSWLTRWWSSMWALWYVSRWPTCGKSSMSSQVLGPATCSVLTTRPSLTPPWSATWHVSSTIAVMWVGCFDCNMEAFVFVFVVCMLGFLSGFRLIDILATTATGVVILVCIMGM